MRTVSEKKRLAIRTERYNINKIRINNKSIRFRNEIKDTQLIRAIDTMMRINKEKERICIEEMKLLLDGKDSRFSVITGVEKRNLILYSYGTSLIESARLSNTDYHVHR